MLRTALLGLIVFATAAAADDSAVSPRELAAEEAQSMLRVLDDSDRARYRRIFELQEDARWGEADALIGELEDEVLKGYVEFQRYMHPTGYRASYDELKRWLAYYADHPNADEIHALAKKRRPKGAVPPLAPEARKWRGPAEGFELHPLLRADYAKTGESRLQRVEGRVRHLCKKDLASQALKEIDKHLARGEITERQYDRMRSWIAASYYFQGYVDGAGRIAEEVARRNGDVAVLSRWIAGLIAFRNGEMEAAKTHFVAMAAVPYQEDNLRSAAGFWAARAALAAGSAESVTPNLEIAAAYPFTFYGQLALSQLGREYPWRWAPPPLNTAALGQLYEDAPAVKRAVALAETGEDLEADLELRWANGRISDAQRKDLLAVAAALDLPAAQIDIALAGGKELEAGLFPIPDYAPSGGFKADRALLYALMRQESKFKVEATSRVGARGLMQLMPRTASYMAKDRSLRGKGKNRLYDPSYNLELGQSYVNHLISTASGGDLFAMAVAYNGGPGNLRRWKREADIDDPLLFIESIPNSESRDFVEKVLTNFWIYRARLGQTPIERDLVAAGKLPLYEALDNVAAE